MCTHTLHACTHTCAHMPMLCKAALLADRLNGTLQDGWRCCAGQSGKYKERGGFNKCNFRCCGLYQMMEVSFPFFSFKVLVCNVHCITTLYPLPLLLCLRALLKFFQSAHLVVRWFCPAQLQKEDG